MKMQDIRTMAKNLKVNSVGKTKPDLIREIQAAEGNYPCFGTVADSNCDQFACCFRPICLEPEKPAKSA